MEIKGGSSDKETLYERIGRLIGGQDSIHKSIDDIKENSTRLWSKLDNIQSTFYAMIDNHQDACPIKNKIENIEKDRDVKSKTFRWFVGVVLTIITIIVSLVALKLYK